MKFPRIVFVHLFVLIHELLLRVHLLRFNLLRFSKELIVSPKTLLNLSIPDRLSEPVHHPILKFSLLKVSVGPDLSAVSMLLVISELSLIHPTIVPVAT